MVSLANNSLYGDMSHERPLENVLVPKYKTRKVSAKRKFPPRCGPNASTTFMEHEEDDGGGIVQASAFRNSETDTVRAIGAGISGGCVEFEALCSSEMADGIGVDGVKTAAVSNPSILCVKSSKMEVEFPSCEAVCYNADKSMMEPSAADSNGMMVESGMPEIQLQDDVECHVHETINNPVGMEMTESLDELVGKVAMSVVDVSANDCVEMMAETKPITVDKLDNMKSDSSNEDTKIGSQPSPKDGKNVVEESRLCTVDSVDKVVIVQNNLLLPSAFCSMKVQSTRLRDKYCHRRVSAERIFPPHCGRNISLPVEEEILIVISGNDCPDIAAKVEFESQHNNMPRLHKSKASTVNSEFKAEKGEAFSSYNTDGIPGALTLNQEKDYGGYSQTIVETTPISSYNPVDGSNNDPARPVVEDAGNSPGEIEEVPSLHFSPVSKVDREIVHCLMAKAFCPWRKGKRVAKSDGKSSEEKGRKQFWGLEAKAVARKSSLQPVSPLLSSKKQKKDCHSNDARSSASKKHKRDHHSNDAHSSAGALTLGPSHDEEIPKYSASGCQPKEFEVNLPRFGSSGSGHVDSRNRVRESLRLFQAICRKLLHEEESTTMPETKSKQPGKKNRRIDLEATKMIKKMGKEVNVDKQILGEIPGVEVGDEFQYRVELTIVGIHRLYQGGIDWMKHNGVPVATSIVSSGAYADDFENSDVLIYCGQGGNVVEKSKAPEDQKLERGNLALRNSMSAKTPVRVIRGWKEPKSSNDPLDTKPKLISTYVYDGLYTVTNYWTETGPHGKQVFMFELRRNPGQPELAWKQLKKTNKSKFRPGVCVQDISGGREHFPISAVNILDNEKPPPFKYISKMKYPDWFRPIPLSGCDCTGKCSDSKRCKCAVRNGGEIPYNRSGALVEIKPLVYECGPHCRCPPSCSNRVAQSGIKFQLEIFKTESRGWGVRALNSIPSGSFICEYVGELLHDKEAEKRVGNDEYLFDIGRTHHDSSRKQKEEEEATFIDPKLDGGGYTIDAAEYGNVGRFVNHCCLPNLYAQDVIYDHGDKRMPHIMLFAMENIPPLQELTYDYNYSMGQVRDTDGNVKVKKCYCGAAECTGRLY